MQARTTLTLTLALLCICALFAGPVAALPPVTGGLAGWYDADNGVVDEAGNPAVDGGRARRWYSSHDSGIFVGHSGLYPWYKTNVLNGHSAVRFANNTMWGQDEAWSNVPASTEYTVFAVTANWQRGSLLRITGHNDPTYHGVEAVELNRSGETTVQRPIHARYRSGSHWSATPQKGYGINDSHTNLLGGNVVEAVFTENLTNAALLLNGWEIGQTRIEYDPGLMHNSARNLQLGYASDAYGWMYGDILEVIVYNRALTAEERIAVRGYLGGKYAVDVVPEPGSLLALAVGLTGVAGLTVRRRR